MKNNRAAVLVGLTVLGIALGGFALIRYVSEGSQFRGGYKLYADFNSSQGLFPQSNVQTAGIRVGKILSMELAPPVPGRPPKARIWIQIDPKMQLWENAEVHKKSASLLGEFYLEIVPGSPVDAQGNKMRKLEDGDEIKYVFEVTTMSEVTDQVANTIPVLREILVDVRKLTSGPIAQIADRLNSSIDRNAVVLERLLGRVDNIAADIEGITQNEADDIRASIENVRDITEGIKNLVGTSQGEVAGTGEKIRSTLDRLQSSVEKLERSLAATEKVTTDVAAGKGTLGRLVTDEEIADNIEQVTEDVGDFVGGIARLQTIVGLRTEYNFLARTLKNYLSVRLQPRPDKYYLFELVDDPRGFREETRTVIRGSNGVEWYDATRISEALRFTFMFAKRLGPVTGRFGILESTGGVGLDLHLLNDRLTLTVDVFDTRSNDYPRVRTRASLAVYGRMFWLVAGADDVLNRDPANAGGGAFADGFFGAQLVFNDQDLKSLLLFGGGSVAGAAGSK